MGWSKVGATATTNVTGVGTFTPSYPQSPTAGNLLILIVALSGFGSTPACATPSGWTLADPHYLGVYHGGFANAGASAQLCALYYRHATGGDTTPSVTVSSNNGGAILLEEWSGGTGTLRAVVGSSSASGIPSTVSGTLSSIQPGDLVFSAVSCSGAGMTGSWGGSASVDTAPTTPGNTSVTTGTATASGTSASPSFSDTGGSNTAGLAMIIAAFEPALTIEPIGIPSEEVLGDATITGGGVALVIEPTGIASGEQLGDASIASITEGHVYVHYALAAMRGQIDLSTATVKAIALTSYAIGTTREDAEFVADILAVATESAGGTYPAGGVPVTGLTFTQVDDSYVVTCDPIVFSSTDIAIAYVLFAVTDPGSDATNPVILWWNLGGTKILSSISPDPDGWLIGRTT